MEDFQSAFLERIRDVAALDTAGRRTAAMHFGGVAIECLLKYIICTSLPKNAIGEWEWKTDSNDPGHTIHNPGHSYNAALRCHNRLRFRVQQLRYVLGWLDDVENPDGHYIDIRYVGKEPDDEKYKRWRKSYHSLVSWLQKYGTKA